MRTIVFIIPWFLCLMLTVLWQSSESNLRLANRRADSYRDVAVQWEANSKRFAAIVDQYEKDIVPKCQAGWRSSINDLRKSTDAINKYLGRPADD
jgi:hypothetical protein